MSNETPFLQSWLGGTFGHVEGDLDIEISDASAVLTTSSYAEIVTFLEDHPDDVIYVSLIVDNAVAGFALRFDGTPGDAIANAAPSFTVFGRDTYWDVYLTDAPLEEVRAFIKDLMPTENDTHALESAVPLPVRDFDVSDEDAARAEEGYRIFSIAELDDIFFPLEATDEATSRINDAEIYGVMSDELADLPIIISTGKSQMEKEWNTSKPMRFEDFFKVVLSKHAVGKKDGNALVTGSLGKSKRRTKNNVLANYLMGLDVDSGASMQDTFDRVRRAGLTAIFYTTHSHETTRVEIASDKFMRWAQKNELDTNPTDELIRRYMREETNYISDVCDSATFVDKVHEDGIKLIVQTRPIDKFRVIFPLETPYVYAEQNSSHKDAIDGWGSRVLGMGRSIGVEVDRAARDPSRLFYLPRHGKDSTNHRILLNCGRLLKFEDIPTASTSTRITDDPFEQAAHIMGGTSRGRILTPTLGLDLGRWAKDRGDGFDIATVFRDHCDDRIRNEQTINKLTIECPFDDDHSNPGDPEDQGTFVCSGGEEAESFIFHCSHAGCHGRDRLTFLQKALQEGWFPDSVFTDERYDLIDRDEDEPAPGEETTDPDEEPVDTTTENYTATFAEAVQAIANLTEGAPARQIENCYRLCAELSEHDRRSLAHKLAKKLGLNKTDVLKRINSLRLNGVGEIEDNTPDPVRVAKILKAKHPRFKKDPKPVIPIIDANISACIDYYVEQCNVVNDQTQTLFSYGDLKIRCGRNLNNTYEIQPLNRAVMQSFAHENMNCAKLNAEGGYTYQPIPEVMAEQACHSSNLSLHKLEGFSDLPYFTRDGKLVTSAGYDRDGERILRVKVELDDKGQPLPSPFAPERLLAVTHENLAKAKEELGFVFTDFPFKDHKGDTTGGQSSRCHLLAMMLQPLVRSMFDGNSPFYLIDKPTAGTGATLMVSTAMYIATGTIPGTVAMSTNDEEVRKTITARFQSGTNVTFFDNLIQPLNSPHLANLATSAEWEDRILGQTYMTKVPNRMQVIVAGNNVRTSDENTRRVLPILLDLGDDPTDPSLNRDFAIEDLKGYVQEYHEELFKYLILIVQYWLKHRPVGWTTKDWTGFTLPSFEQYCAVMGSIMETIGVEGFGDNCKYIKADNSDKQAWNTFFSEVASKFRSGKKGEFGPFSETKTFTMAEMAGVYVDWTSPLELRVNGRSRPVSGREVDEVNREFNSVLFGIQDGIFRIHWEVARDQYEEVKVRFEMQKDPKGNPFFILRRVDSAQQAA